MTEKLVRIGKGPPVQSFALRFARGPVADKFFACALLAGLFGSTFLGVHLWFMRRGLMKPWLAFYDYRELHALIQLYLFFGLFILGFALQAGPKLLAARSFSSRVLLLIPLTVAGVLLRFLFGPTVAVNLVLAAPFLVAVWLLSGRILRSQGVNVLAIGVLILLGLGFLALGAFLQVGDAAQAALLLWGGVASVLFGAGQQFISTALGGRTLDSRSAVIFIVLHCVALAALMILTLLSPSQPFWRVAASALLLCAMIYYLRETRLLIVLGKRWRSPMHVAFGCGYLWAVAGAIVVGLPGERFDLTLHLWALGWVLPIVVAVSSQIMNFLAGARTLHPVVVMVLLILWQYVPIDRGLDLSSLPILTWADGIIVSAVFAYWAWGLLRGAALILRRQFVLAKDAAVVSC